MGKGLLSQSCLLQIQQYFIDFFLQLDTVSERSQIKATCHLLSDINEKIIAAIALKTIHNTYENYFYSCSFEKDNSYNLFDLFRHAAVIDEAIDITLKKRNEYPPENLTQQDIFYVQITRIHEFFKSLASCADEIVQQEQMPAKASQILLDISQIVLVKSTDSSIKKTDFLGFFSIYC